MLFKSTGYDNLPMKRERANTAPSIYYDEINNEKQVKNDVRKISAGKSFLV